MMQNTTARLAIELQKLPPFSFDWSDTSPQRDRLSLKVDDILASEEDGMILHSRMVSFMMNFLVENFSSLNNLKHFLRTQTSQKKAKSNVLPMKLLFQDESRTDDNIQILQQLIQDAALNGDPQVSVLSLTE